MKKPRRIAIEDKNSLGANKIFPEYIFTCPNAWALGILQKFGNLVSNFSEIKGFSGERSKHASKKIFTGKSGQNYPKSAGIISDLP